MHALSRTFRCESSSARDDVVSVTDVRSMLESCVRRVIPDTPEYPNLGHVIGPVSYAQSGLLPWLFAQKCNHRGQARHGDSTARFCDRSTKNSSHSPEISSGAKPRSHPPPGKLSPVLWFTLSRLRIDPLPPLIHGYSADQRHCGRCRQ